MKRGKWCGIMEIVVEHYTKIIKGITILDDVNLSLHSGVCYGLQGRNGSGKTMLMRAVCGLIRPTKGWVKIDGKRIGKDMSFPQSVGVLIENPSFLPYYTGKRNLQLLAAIQGHITDKEIGETLTSVGLDPEDKRKYRKYSLGMKQKLGIAAAFMEQPELIILDEPINAIDVDGVVLVKEMIRQAKSRGAILIVACHDKEELEELSDEVIHISGGRAVQKGEVSPQGTGDEKWAI